MRFPDLNALLAGISWAVVGAAATRFYMPECATQVFDIPICSGDAAEARRSLREAGFRQTGELSIGGSAWQAPDGFPVDVIESSAAWCADAVREAATNRDAQGNPVFLLPYLALMKFEASRVQDVADLTRMLGQASPESRNEVRQVFKKYQSEGLEDLESLIMLGQLEADNA